MKSRWFLVLLVVIGMFMTMNISGCAHNTGNVQTSTTQQVGQVTLQGIVVIGQTLQAVPPIAEAFYNAGNLTKDQYNQIVATYNQALGAYMILKDSAEAAVLIGKDPKDSASYVNAMTSFLMQQNLLNNMLLAFGVTPAQSK